MLAGFEGAPNLNVTDMAQCFTRKTPGGSVYDGLFPDRWQNLGEFHRIVREVCYTVIGQFTEMSRNARNIRFPTGVSGQNERQLLVVKTGDMQL